MTALDFFKGGIIITSQIRTQDERTGTLSGEELKKAFEELAQSHRENEFKILKDYKGNTVNTARNYRNIIHCYSEMPFGKIRFNELKHAPEKTVDGVTTPWSDSDDSGLRTFIEYEFGIYSKQKFEDGFNAYLQMNSYHPIKDKVRSINWDKKSRIYSFLTKWLRADNSAYTKEVSRLIFAGGIFRLFEPGCKFDDMPVLIGTRQGEGKSTIVRWLAMKDDYFSEVTEFEGQKAIEALEGAWICEVSELLALTKTKEQEAVKSYLTRLNDRYRMPFDRRVSEHPRQCIFIGTTNKEQFLTDKTGNRRFYPVRVWQTAEELFKNKEQVQYDIEQCWAEAYELYKQGKLRPYADPDMIELIREKQAEATQDDYRIGLISDFLETKDEVCVPMLWYEALNMRSDIKPTRKDSNEIALIMQSMEGWVRKPSKRFKDYGTQQCWKKEWIVL